MLKANTYKIFLVFLIFLSWINYSNVYAYAIKNYGFLSLNRVISSSMQIDQDEFIEGTTYWLNQAAKFTTTRQSAQLGLSILLFALGEEDKALSLWGEVQLPPHNFLVWAEQARQDERNEQALIWCERAIELTPDFAEAWHQKGLIELDLGQDDEAIVTLRNAVQLGSPESVDVLASILQDRGNDEDARSVWQQALVDFPEYEGRLNWWYGVINILQANKQWKTALETYRAALVEYPDTPRLLVDYGWTLYYTGEDFSISVQPIYRAIEIDKNFMLAYARMADIMAREGQLENAYLWYDKAIERATPEHTGLIVSQANVARAMEDYPLAIERYKLAIERTPDYARAYFELAWAYYLNGDFEQAIVSIEEAILLMGTPDAAFYIRAGAIYESSGLIEKALTKYQQAQELLPDNALIQENIARLQQQ